jgi:hypothetical protein
VFSYRRTAGSYPQVAISPCPSPEQVVRNKSRIKDLLQESVSKMIHKNHNHAEALAMKESIKLNIAMLETAKCILTGSKDKGTINPLLDNMWGLINKSRLRPTHKQEMTSVIMNLKCDRDRGRHLELENVLNQIMTVFCRENEQQEELAAVLASAEPRLLLVNGREFECDFESELQTIKRASDSSHAPKLSTVFGVCVHCVHHLSESVSVLQISRPDPSLGVDRACFYAQQGSALASV